MEAFNSIKNESLDGLGKQFIFFAYFSLNKDVNIHKRGSSINRQSFLNMSQHASKK